MKCKHNYPKRRMPPRYTTEHYLMCGRCKKKIRRLTATDKERMRYAEELRLKNDALAVKDEVKNE